MPQICPRFDCLNTSASCGLSHCLFVRFLTLLFTDELFLSVIRCLSRFELLCGNLFWIIRNLPNQWEEKLCLDLLIIGDLVGVVGTRLCDNCSGLNCRSKLQSRSYIDIVADRAQRLSIQTRYRRGLGFSPPSGSFGVFLGFPKRATMKSPSRDWVQIPSPCVLALIRTPADFQISLMTS